MKINEKKLIRLVKQGDSDSFTFLYNKYISQIYKYIYFKTHHTETAQDLTSITFVKALEKINNFNEDSGMFKAWVYRIARNTVIDHYRTTKVNMNIDDAWDISSNDNVQKNIEDSDQIEKVKKYLSKLSVDKRDILIMRIWQQLSYKEISAITGKSIPSCKMNFSRTINKLRQDMPIAILISLIINL